MDQILNDYSFFTSYHTPQHHQKLGKKSTPALPQGRPFIDQAEYAYAKGPNIILKSNRLLQVHRHRKQHPLKSNYHLRPVNHIIDCIGGFYEGFLR